ncbi:MAG: FAD-dependent oxidoreductase [Christensenellales bacterium]|jgi:glycine/D-amino acid oxidase-like deaminating enzyme
MHQSVWQDSVKEAVRPPQTLQENIETDVLIIGGGMAGILCAHKLKQAGVSCVVVEAKRVGSGTTGSTTAKITAQHGLIYQKLIKKNGVDDARRYYEANMTARQDYEKLSETYPCDFEVKTAYTYSLTNRKKVVDEARAYEKLGIKPVFQDSPPLPFQTAETLGMENQAQFNPLKLLLALANELTVYENTFVTEIRENTAVTKNGVIKAKKIVLATHFPLVNIPGMYFLKMYQHRSYVIALENAPDVDGMYVDEQEKGNSFRNYNGLLLIGGGDHKTGAKGGNYEELRQLAKTAYPDAKEKYAWATQDCMTLDGVPYIGVHRKSAPHIYVATGFNKWGMTGSMVAANVLRDLITLGSSEYEELFSPQRSMLQPQLLVNGFSALGNLILPGKRCPHMGCSLRWNRAERTWDCPCHGSRFDEHGNLIDNPAKRGIKVE